MKIRYSLILFLFLFTLNAKAQEKLPNYTIGDFLGVGGGIATLNLRDNGVSPLFYDGWLPMVSVNWNSETEKNSFELYGSYGYGNLTRTELTIYTSSVHSINHGASYLFKVWESSKNPNLHLKIGPVYQGITNIRNTPSFRNAGSTAESINSLGLGARLELLFDKNKDNRKLFWLIPLRPGRRVSRLSYQLNLPGLNAIWSPTFAYLDDFTDGTVDYNSKNELKTGGLRIQSNLAYQYFLSNGNSFRFQYFWDVFKGPNDSNQIEFAQHQAQISLLIRLSKL